MLQETYLLTLGEFEFFANEDQLTNEEQFYWMFFIIATII